VRCAFLKNTVFIHEHSPVLGLFAILVATLMASFGKGSTFEYLFHIYDARVGAPTPTSFTYIWNKHFHALCEDSFVTQFFTFSTLPIRISIANTDINSSSISLLRFYASRRSYNTFFFDFF
jgi:hypothetical protein